MATTPLTNSQHLGWGWGVGQGLRQYFLKLYRPAWNL